MQMRSAATIAAKLIEDMRPPRRFLPCWLDCNISASSQAGGFWENDTGPPRRRGSPAFNSFHLGLLPGISGRRSRDRTDLFADIGEHHAAVRHFLFGQAALRACRSLDRSRHGRGDRAQGELARTPVETEAVAIVLPVPAVIAEAPGVMAPGVIAPLMEAPGVEAPLRVRTRQVAREAGDFQMVGE